MGANQSDTAGAQEALTDAEIAAQVGSASFSSVSASVLSVKHTPYFLKVSHALHMLGSYRHAVRISEHCNITKCWLWL